MQPISSRVSNFSNMDISYDYRSVLDFERVWGHLKAFLSYIDHWKSDNQDSLQELRKSIENIKLYGGSFVYHFLQQMKAEDFDRFVDKNDNYKFKSSLIENFIKDLYKVFADYFPDCYQKENIRGAIFEIPLDRLCHVFLNKEHPMALPLEKPRFNLQSFPLVKFLAFSPKSISNIELMGSSLQKKENTTLTLFARSFLNQIKQSTDPLSILSQINKLGHEVIQSRLKKFILESVTHQDLFIYQDKMILQDLFISRDLVNQFIELYCDDRFSKAPKEDTQILLFIHKLLKDINQVLGQECELNLLKSVPHGPSKIASQKYALIMYAFLNIQTEEDAYTLIDQLKESQQALEIRDENGRTFLMFFMRNLEHVRGLFGQFSKDQHLFISSLIQFFKVSKYERIAKDYEGNTILHYSLRSILIGMFVKSKACCALPYLEYYCYTPDEFAQLQNTQSLLDSLIPRLINIAQYYLSSPLDQIYNQLLFAAWLNLVKALTELNITLSPNVYNQLDLFCKTKADALKNANFNFEELKDLLYNKLSHQQLLDNSLLSMSPSESLLDHQASNTHEDFDNPPDPLLGLTANLNLETNGTRNLPFWDNHSFEQIIHNPLCYTHILHYCEQVKQNPYEFALKCFSQIPFANCYTISPFGNNQAIFFEPFERLLEAFYSPIQPSSHFVKAVLKEIFKLPFMDAYYIFFSDSSSFRFPFEKWIKASQLDGDNELFSLFDRQCKNALDQPVKLANFDSQACTSTLNFLIPLMAAGAVFSPNTRQLLASLSSSKNSILKTYPHLESLTAYFLALSSYFKEISTIKASFMTEWLSFLQIKNEEEKKDWLEHLKKNNLLEDFLATPSNQFLSVFLRRLNCYGEILLNCKLSFSRVQIETLCSLSDLYKPQPDVLKSLTVSTLLNLSALIQMSIESKLESGISHFIINFIDACPSVLSALTNLSLLKKLIQNNVFPLLEHNNVEKLKALIKIIKAFSDKGVKARKGDRVYSLLMQLKNDYANCQNEEIQSLLQQLMNYLLGTPSQEMIDDPSAPSQMTSMNDNSASVSLLQNLSNHDLQQAQKLYQELAKQIANQWNTESLQLNLRRLMALASGKRKIDLALALDDEGGYDTRGIQAILRPFKNLLTTCAPEKKHLAKAVIQDVIWTLPLEFSNQTGRETFFNLNDNALDSWLCSSLESKEGVEHYMQQEGISTLAFTNEEKSKHVAAIRDFLFYFSLKELEIRAKDLQASIAQQRSIISSYVCKAAALFYSIHNQSYVYPLTIVQQMPSGSIVAIGEDTGSTQAKLQDIVEFDGKPLNSSQMQALKDYYEQHKSLKDFYLLSPIPKSFIATRPDEMELSPIPVESNSNQSSLSVEAELENILEEMSEDENLEQALEQEKNLPKRKMLKMAIETSSAHLQNNNNNHSPSSKTTSRHHLSQMVIGHDSFNLLSSSDQRQVRSDSDQEDEVKETSHNKKRKTTVSHTLGTYVSNESLAKKSKKSSSSEEEGAIFDIDATLIRKASQTELTLLDNTLEGVLQAFGHQAVEKIKFIKDVNQSDAMETLLKVTGAIRKSLNDALKWLPVDSFADRQHKNYQKNTIEAAFRLAPQGMGYLACYEPGLGKTKAGIGTCHEAQKASPQPILIVVPNSLKPQWREGLFQHFFAMRKDYYASLIESWEQLTGKQRVLITQAIQTLINSQYPKIDDCKKTIAKKTTELKQLPQSPSSQKDKIKQKSLKQEIHELQRQQKLFEERLKDSQALAQSLANANMQKPSANEILILDSSLIVGNIYDQVIDYKSSSLQSVKFNFADSSTHYKIAITTIHALNGLKNLEVEKEPWSKILIDEVHEFSWDFADPDALKSKKQALRILNLIDDLSKNHGTTPFLMTGTPFVNCLGDLFAQIRLANPKHRFFPLMELVKNREAFLNTCLSKILKGKLEESDIIKPLADWLLAAEHCRNLFNSLMDVHTKKEPSIRQAWTTPDGKTLLPESKKRPQTLVLTKQQKEAYNKHFKGLNVFEEETSLANFLFHPHFLMNEEWKKAKSKDLKNWIQAMSQEEIVQFIGQSSLLSFIFTNPEIKQVLASGKRAIFFLPQKRFAAVLKLLFKRMFESYSQQNPQAFKVKIYNGDKNPEVRSEAVRAFEEKNGKTRVLMLTPKAGGVGLNLPSAEYVFDVAPWWNPAMKKQKISRAERAGKEGETFIYTFNFGTPLELHKSYAAKTKRLWSKAFLSKTSSKFTLPLFVNALIYEYISVLRSASNIQAVEQKVEEQMNKLKEVLDPALQLLLEQLEDPESHFAKQIQAVCQITEQQPESSMLIPKKVKIGAAHFQMMPLPTQDAQRARLLAHAINAQLPKMGRNLLDELNHLPEEEWEAFIEDPQIFILSSLPGTPTEQIYQLNQNLNIQQAQGNARWFRIAHDSSQNGSDHQPLNLVAVDSRNPGREGTPRLSELSTCFGKRYFMLIKLA